MITESVPVIVAQAEAFMFTLETCFQSAEVGNPVFDVDFKNGAEKLEFLAAFAGIWLRCVIKVLEELRLNTTVASIKGHSTHFSTSLQPLALYTRAAHAYQSVIPCISYTAKSRL